MTQSQPGKKYVYSARVMVERTEVNLPIEPMQDYPPHLRPSMIQVSGPATLTREPEPVEIGSFEASASELIDLFDKVVAHFEAVAIDERKEVAKLSKEVARLNKLAVEVSKEAAAERLAKEALQRFIEQDHKVHAAKLAANGQTGATATPS